MLTWIDYFIKGGFVMYPILFCSIFALAIALERAIILRKKNIIPEEFTLDIKKLLSENEIERAISLCRDDPRPIARIIEAGLLKYHTSKEEIRGAMQAEGKIQANYLEKYLAILATIASISPLLGLLGTVTGMIRVFNVITSVGVAETASLSSGISEALITTAAGLMVAIPTVVVHNYFKKKAAYLLNLLEKTSTEIFELLTINR